MLVACGLCTVTDLKVALLQRAGIKPSRLRLVPPAGRLCEEDDGLLAIWVQRDPNKVFEDWGIQPSAVINSLSELQETLKNL